MMDHYIIGFTKLTICACVVLCLFSCGTEQTAQTDVSTLVPSAVEMPISPNTEHLTSLEMTVIAADDLTAAEEALRELIEAHPEYADEYAVYEAEIEAMLSELCELYTDPDTGVVGREWRFMWMAKRAEMIQAFVLQYGE